MTGDRPFVIVGAGLAAAKAAQALRERGFSGPVVVVGDEPVRPYERPPLSKGLLSGEAAAESTFVHEEGFYTEHEIELRTGTRVTRLDPGDHTVTLDDGSVLPFAKALLATGSAPRTLAVPGADLAGVHTLRTLADALALSEAAAAATSAAVVGAGWIGSEVTASLRRRGLPVALIDPAEVPLQRVLGPEVGAIYRDLHAGHGVRLHLGDGVRSLHGSGRVEAVRTTSGALIEADLVVIGVGALPRVELAAGAGLAVADGVSTDEQLRTSHPDVYAAGDVASARHPLLGARLRVEHWANALNQGTVAAANMLGAQQPYTALPYFFSDQYDLGMEYTGHCPEWDEVVLRGHPGSGTFIAFWLRQGVVRAAMNANVWDVNEHLQDLVARGLPVGRHRLRDQDVPLSRL